MDHSLRGFFSHFINYEHRFGDELSHLDDRLGSVLPHMRGKPVRGLGRGNRKIRCMKDGKHIILDADGRIVSFRRQR